ncbi:MAG: TIGR03773 family transporter-associated surface protein [Acidimicrobiia bacterium]
MNRTGHRLLLELFVVFLILIPTSSAVAQTEGGELAPLGEQVVIDNGHVDIGPIYIDGAWGIRIKDDTGDAPVWRRLEDVALRAIDSSQIAVPEAGYEFLGSPGAVLWLLPQAQTLGVLWPGWNTQHPTVVEEIRTPITWTLHGLEGPGSMILFLSGSFGEPEVLFDSNQPYPQMISVPLGTHVHGNWTFDQPGTYRLDIEMSAETHTGESESDRRNLSFVVGDATDSTAVFTSTSSPADATEPDTADDPDEEPASRNALWVLSGLAAVSAVALVLVVAQRRGRAR